MQCISDSERRSIYTCRPSACSMCWKHAPVTLQKEVDKEKKDKLETAVSVVTWFFLIIESIVKSDYFLAFWKHGVLQSTLQVLK